MTCHIVSSVGAVRFSNSKASWCLGRITQVFPDKVSWIFRLRKRSWKRPVCVCVWTMNYIDVFTYMWYIEISSPVSIPKTGQNRWCISEIMFHDLHLFRSGSFTNCLDHLETTGWKKSSLDCTLEASNDEREAWALFLPMSVCWCCMISGQNLFLLENPSTITRG